MNSTSHITCFKDILKGHYRRHLKMTVATWTITSGKSRPSLLCFLQKMCHLAVKYNLLLRLHNMCVALEKPCPSTASTNPLSYLWDSLSKPDLCQQSFANAFRSRRDPYNLPPQYCIYFRVLNVRRILFYVFFRTSFDHPIPSTRIKYT